MCSGVVLNVGNVVGRFKILTNGAVVINISLLYESVGGVSRNTQQLPCNHYFFIT